MLGHTVTGCVRLQDEENATLFQRRFRAAWVHARVVSYAVHLLEAKPMGDHKKAVDWLQKLLRSPHIPSARPDWWDRLTIDLRTSLDEPEKAWAACADALTDPWLADENAPEYGKIQGRFITLSKKLRELEPGASPAWSPTIVQRGEQVTLERPDKPKDVVEVIRGVSTQAIRRLLGVFPSLRGCCGCRPRRTRNRA